MEQRRDHAERARPEHQKTGNFTQTRPQEAGGRFMGRLRCVDSGHQGLYG